MKDIDSLILFQDINYVVVNKPPNIHIDGDYDITIEKTV